MSLKPTSLTLVLAEYVGCVVGELVERQLFLVCSSGVDSVYTEIVPDATKRTLQAIIRGKADIASIIHTDRWRGYDGLVDVCFDKHLRVNHGNNEFARGSVHVNGIESFWSYAKRRMVQFNGVPRHTFYLHLKETEFRFNHRHSSLYKALLSLLRSDPL